MKTQELIDAGFRKLNPGTDKWTLASYSIDSWDAEIALPDAVLQRAEECLLMSLRVVMMQRAALRAAARPLINQVPPASPDQGLSAAIDDLRQRITRAHGVPVEQVIVLQHKQAGQGG